MANYDELPTNFWHLIIIFYFWCEKDETMEFYLAFSAILKLSWHDSITVRAITLIYLFMICNDRV